MCGPY
jgi:hypothetical protein